MYKLYKISGNTENFPQFEHFHNLSKEFLPFAQKRLGFDKPVSVNLLSDPQNAKNPLGKTAYYEPGKMKITLFVDKRHVKDILRSMAHELVHHAQNCRGEFKNGFKTGEGYAQEDGHMREMEREAYEKGQMILRDFEDKRKKTMKEEKSTTTTRDDEVSWETACIGAEPMKHFMMSGRDCEDALKKSWPDEGTCFFVPIPNAEEMMSRACSQLNDPKRMAKRKEMLRKSKLRPSYISFHRGPLRGQKIRVTGFDHAYQWAQSLGVYQFYYEGRKGGKFISKNKFKTDLYEYDPTRTGERRKLEESTSTLKENKTMAELENPKKADLDKDGKLTSYEKARGKAIEKSISGDKEEQNEGKGEKCEKCDRTKGTNEGQCPGPNESHCPGKRDDKKLEEADDKATVQKQLEKWEEKCAKPGANKNMCKQKIDLLKARLKKLNEDSSDNTLEEDAGEKKTKWVIDGDTVLCDEGCTKKEAEARIKKRADAREKGKSQRKDDEMNEGWTNKKDQLLFERLVKKWAK